MDPVELGMALERNRRRSRLTQAQLAELMGTKQPAISRAEKGRVTPTLEFLDRWTGATGRPLHLDLGPARKARIPDVRTGAGRGKQTLQPWERAEMRRTKSGGQQ
ncbi:MAG: helix-turn-helix domain-containing protein [Actinobacteria bacterium]|nr:helix-turn-helix domain-containing protein [Actinomycetota bacterium]